MTSDQQATSVVETNGLRENSDTDSNTALKRRRTEDDVNGSIIHVESRQCDCLVSGAPRHITPDPQDPDNRGKDIHLHYHDDDEDGYEWVRLPKKRNYDLFRVARQEPEKRNQAALPLTATRHDNKPVIM